MVRCFPQRVMTAGNVGNEDTENPRILWPGPSAHPNIYETKEVLDKIHVASGPHESKRRHGD